MIGAASLASAGVFGSLYSEWVADQAQSGVPGVHCGVALMDATDTIVTTETSFDDTLVTDFFSANGAEADVYNVARR